MRGDWPCRCGVLLLLSGCSSASRLAAGPVTSYVNDGRRPVGAELLARSAAGESNGERFRGLEAAAKLVATQRIQSLAVGVGPAVINRAGAGFMMIDAAALLGLQSFDDTFLAMGSVHLAAGGGVTLASESSTFTHGPMPSGISPAWTEMHRKSTVLTLELMGGLDTPFTRTPQVSVGLLLGVAWINERYTVDLPWRARPGAW